MTIQSRSTYAGWNKVLKILSATQLCVALAFGAVYAWHISRIGAHARTHILVSSWIAWGFVFASLVVVAGSLSMRRLASSAGVRPAAIWPVAFAWLIVAGVWMTSD